LEENKDGNSTDNKESKKNKWKTNTSMMMADDNGA
jgi:hypothetical protein